MTQRKIALLLTIYMVVSLAVTAQDKWIRRGDHAYDHGDVERALELYDWAYKKKKSPEAAARLGKCYWRENKYAQAEKYFRIAATVENPNAEDIFLFANSLMANEKYEEALDMFKTYRGHNPYDKRTKDHIQACEEYEHLLADSTLYEISMAPFNSHESDFSPIYYNNGIMFTSARRNDMGVVFTSTMTEHPLLDIYYTTLGDNGKWHRPKVLPGDVNTKFNEGPACISPDGKHLYFTRNNFHEGNRGHSAEKINKLKIYQAEMVNGKWTNITPLHFNHDEYAVGHPALNPDGDKLYFVSDMPGGYGQTDLYVCHWENDAWGEPKNLGPSINTEGDEMFPFVHEDGTLYFSSNGRFGLGDLDIYSAQWNGKTWTRLHNLGYPINSSMDDFGIALAEDKRTGWISSNRGNRKHPKDNIYRIEIGRPEFKCKPQAENNYCVVFYETGSIDIDTLPFTYEWALGDGTFKRGLEVEHCYAGPGTYIVELNVIDTVSEVLFFNQATYEFVIEDTQQVILSMPEAAEVGELVEFSGSETNLPNMEIKNWYWDFGDGILSHGETVEHEYRNEGTYEVSLGVTGYDIDSGFEVKACRYKQLKVLKPTQYEEFVDSVRAYEDSLWTALDSKVVEERTTPDNMDTAYTAEEPKPAGEVAETKYDIKDHPNARFGVQITNSKDPIPTDSSYFKGLPDVQEFEDETGYSYVVGDKPTIEEVIPVYSQVVSLEFDNPMVVAFEEDNIISGHDSTFIVRLPGMKTPVTFSVVKGILRDRAGTPIEGDIKWEDLIASKLYATTRTDPHGRYIMELPNGKMYGFYADVDSVYPVSDNIDLRNVKTHMTYVGNIEVVSINDMIESSMAVRINNIFFDFDKYDLKAESRRELDRLARILIENDHMGVEIMGHTDNWGTTQYNQRLSQKRANSVLKYLILAGYDTRKISAVGYGEAKPVAPNTTAAGRKLNRRVEFRFVRHEASQ